MANPSASQYISQMANQAVGMSVFRQPAGESVSNTTTQPDDGSESVSLTTRQSVNWSVNQSAFELIAIDQANQSVNLPTIEADSQLVSEWVSQSVSH